MTQKQSLQIFEDRKIRTVWDDEQYDKLRQSIRQPIQPKKNRGLKL